MKWKERWDIRLQDAYHGTSSWNKWTQTKCFWWAYLLLPSLETCPDPCFGGVITHLSLMTGLPKLKLVLQNCISVVSASPWSVRKVLDKAWRKICRASSLYKCQLCSSASCYSNLVLCLKMQELCQWETTETIEGAWEIDLCLASDPQHGWALKAALECDTHFTSWYNCLYKRR